MLRLRVITALALMAVLLPALFAPGPLPFALLALAAVSAAGWEWARLNTMHAEHPGAQGQTVRPPVDNAAWSLGSGAILAVACLATGYWWPGGPGGSGLWWVAATLWIVGGTWALRAGPAGWGRQPVALRWLLGLVLLWLAWLAMVQARTLGINFLLSILCVVWAADIAAYFGGRAFGRRKLAPSISPGKSWEGVYAGVLGVLVLAQLWINADARWTLDSPSLFTLLDRHLGTALSMLACAALAGLSVMGDLFESLVKRSAGAKDSSALLPGHGGVLDRIDALLPVLPAALALAML
ncbi:MAG: phosphatidate cytidylyltransferase [Burkholderiaceae bacterium]|jgi:phosphatidate cytidylyltransferase|nr:phosphatidate cytidylyltransferase [Aquabacterium sp.]NUP84336.1 phosphatidate cytidylyltransferase [Burkholderiaceae bacterium]